MHLLFQFYLDYLFLFFSCFFLFCTDYFIICYFFQLFYAKKLVLCFLSLIRPHFFLYLICSFFGTGSSSNVFFSDYCNYFRYFVIYFTSVKLYIIFFSVTRMHIFLIWFSLFIDSGLFLIFSFFSKYCNYFRYRFQVFYAQKLITFFQWDSNASFTIIWLTY